jgi:hypothetical protein
VSFPEQCADSLAEAILAFESCGEIFTPDQIQLLAYQFDRWIFVDRMHNYISSVMVEPPTSFHLTNRITVCSEQGGQAWPMRN